MYPFLDIVLTAAHAVVIIFNLVGWIWQKTRKLHLILIALTALSWGLLGFWYGWGYCFLTDWHWQVKRQLGETGLPDSFITYAIQAAGWDVDPTKVDTVTAIGFGMVVLLSVILNMKDYRQTNRP